MFQRAQYGGSATNSHIPYPQVLHEHGYCVHRPCAGLCLHGPGLDQVGGVQGGRGWTQHNQKPERTKSLAGEQTGRGNGESGGSRLDTAS